jgi:2-polyprenyl-3-methyl-5-hydroxy-6-metoxy-1,4-benzoquinol methylase
MGLYLPLKIYDPAKRIGLATDRIRYFCELLTGRTVLHVGCADYPITQQRLTEDSLLHNHLVGIPSRLVGVDISEPGLKLLRQIGLSNLLLMDAEDLSLNASFDVVLASDVLEHVSNPGRFLNSAARVLRPHGELIVSVPSALTASNLRTYLGRGEQVHHDHTAYYSPKTLAALCHRYGFVPTKLTFTVQPKTEGESHLFIALRRLILTAAKAMSPSFIMHFKSIDHVDSSLFFVWK